jgi:putative membrane protein
MRFHATTLTAIATVALALLPACEDRPGTTTTTGANATRRIAAPPPSPTAGLPTLTDAQILEVIHTANAGEIAQAKLAQQKATDPRVQRLAAMMIADHTEADQKVSEIASKDSLVMSESPVSATVQTSGDHATDDLEAKNGKAFDADYVQTQINEHQAVLDTIDQTLTSDATNQDVVSLLRTVRAKVAEHLEHAKRVESQLGK